MCDDKSEPFLKHSIVTDYMIRYNKFHIVNFRPVNCFNVAWYNKKPGFRSLMVNGRDISGDGSKLEVAWCTKCQYLDCVSCLCYSADVINNRILLLLLQDVISSLSVPDLLPLEEKLSSLKKAVYRAFPSFRWEASYNAISYRRVRFHLNMFKVCQFVMWPTSKKCLGKVW